MFEPFYLLWFESFFCEGVIIFWDGDAEVSPDIEEVILDATEGDGDIVGGVASGVADGCVCMVDVAESVDSR